MKRVLLLLLLLLFSSLIGCSKHTPAPAQDAAAQPSIASATPSPSPSAMGQASTLAMPSGAPPAAPNFKGGKDAKADQKALPPVIGDRLYRALTLEEINQMPPETRDMILRAQGRLPASPAPSPKKK